MAVRLKWPQRAAYSRDCLVPSPFLLQRICQIDAVDHASVKIASSVLRPRAREIGHMKAEGHLGRCSLKGRAGDAANTILTGVGYNFQRILAWLRAFCAKS